MTSPQGHLSLLGHMIIRAHVRDKTSGPNENPLLLIKSLHLIRLEVNVLEIARPVESSGVANPAQDGAGICGSSLEPNKY